MATRWRKCASCGGTCHWHDTDWVCDWCGDEWNEDFGVEYREPGMCRAKNCGLPEHSISEHPHGQPVEAS